MSENTQDRDGWTNFVRKNALPPMSSDNMQIPKFGLLSTKSPQILERIPGIQAPTDKPYYEIKFPDEPTANELAIACANLLYSLENSRYGVPESYRISFQVKPRRLILKIPPKFWYDQILQGGNKVNTAREWVKEVKSTTTASGTWNRRDEPLMERIPEYCGRGLFCNRYWSAKGCLKKHPAPGSLCAFEVRQRDNSTALCNFMVFDELVVPLGLKDERFLVQVRQDKHLTRDILFYPKPAEFQVSQMTLLKSDGTPAKKYETNVNISKVEQIEIKIPFVEIWPGHFENEAMVRSEEMWSFALEAISKLTSISGVNSTHELVTEVAFNFGNWESKLYDDYRSLECHGHGHLILTEGGQRALSNHSEIGKFFRGRYNDPFQYDLEDAENLDSSRLSPDRLDNIDARLDKMDARLDKMDARLDKMDARLDKMDARLDKMDARLDKMDARFDKLETNIDEMKSLLIRALSNER